MGLDMYLTKRHYVQNWDHHPPERKIDITIKRGGKKHPFINPSKITYVTEELGYWRKANQIHAWFINHCNEGEDRCVDIDVTRGHLQELYDTCVLVRDNSKLIDGKDQHRIIEDSSIAEDLLPGQEGFFFGGTEYDEWYLKQILDTIEILKPELDIDYDKEGIYEPEYSYRPSW